MSNPPINRSRTVLISGGSGFVGNALIPALRQAGWKPIILTRSATTPQPPGACGYDNLDSLDDVYAVINLAGANIGAQRWTKRRKLDLRNSRIDTTRQLCEWVTQCEQPPEVFVSASAIGYYGETGDRLTDESGAPGNDFGATLCRDWEKAVSLPDSIRQLTLRIGVVLGHSGGALQRMLLPFKLGLGGPVGNGQQWMSWISRRDLVRLILVGLDHDRYAGVFNAVAPEPVTNRAFASALGTALNRPAFLPLPSFVLRLLMGEMSSLLLNSQRIESTRLRETGFAFEQPLLQSALRHAVDAKSDY